MWTKFRRKTKTIEMYMHFSGTKTGRSNRLKKRLDKLSIKQHMKYKNWEKYMEYFVWLSWKISTIRFFVMCIIEKLLRVSYITANQYYKSHNLFNKDVRNYSIGTQYEARWVCTVYWPYGRRYRRRSTGAACRPGWGRTCRSCTRGRSDTSH